MMQHTPGDRLNLRQDLLAVRVMSETVVVLIPTAVTDGTYDVDTDAARDVSVGDGTGRTWTWLTQQVIAMIREVDVNLITFGSVPPGAELGDLLITIGVRDGETLITAQRNKEAYVWARGARYRPAGINGLGVARVEDYIVQLRKAGQTVARHPDY